MTYAVQPLLAIEDISVQIRTGLGLVRAVEWVSLSLGQGETLALVGESGCGKSMLCRAIMGILPGQAELSSDTRIIFDGRDLGALPGRERNRIRGREIGMVLQNPLSALNPVQTIGRQLMEPMRYHLGMPAPEAKRKAVELLDAVGISQSKMRFAAYPHELSGGMRQRVAIAIAIACEPKLLIADEPTTALDVTVQAEVLNLLARLQRERNMAMLLVSHDLSVVAGWSDHTAVMYAGRIVEQAPTRKLFRHMRMPYTRALFDAIPNIDAPPNTKLVSIDGQPPDLTAPATGCPFAPRCSSAKKKCSTETPLLTATGNQDHVCACWYPLEGADE